MHTLARSRDKATAIVGLCIVFGVPALPLSRWENEFGGVLNLLAYELIWWILIAYMLFHVRIMEQRPMSSLGFRRFRLRDSAIAMLTGVLTVISLATVYFVIFPALHLSETAKVNQLLSTPFWWRIISVIRAAVAEEILFRGYAISRLQELTGSLKFAAIFSCAVFTVEHVGPWGWSHLLIAGIGGVIFTALYLWRKNLWINIIAHFIVDGTAVLLG